MNRPNRAILTLALAAMTAAGAAAAPKPKKDKPARPKPATRKIPAVTKDKIICFALYTVHRNTLKLTAHLYPLEQGDARTVRLETGGQGRWKQIAEAEVVEPGWTAAFKVENWDSARDVGYRLAHGKTAFYTGLIRRDPVEKETIVVAAFTGNSETAGHGGTVSKKDIYRNLAAQKPDLLFFSGDQVYNHREHIRAWLRFGREFGDLTRNIPTICIPDDHDVGQPNLWGAGGKASTLRGAADGGYSMPVKYVKMVERAQTGNLPDPYDPTPIKRGIGVYYTALTLGGISFAIIEDRKFKSGPAGLVPKMGPRPDHIRDPKYDPKVVDVPGATLLGERQLKFLRHWAADWTGADMKVVLSQTVFANLAHMHGSKTNRMHADMDSNGWPQTGRNKALREIRKGFALMLGGDQHLGTMVHHGIDDWNDAGYSFCVPSIANLYLRFWSPQTPGGNHVAGMPRYTGEYKDGFGNKVTMLAAGNPGVLSGRAYLPKGPLRDRSAGYGIVKLNRSTRKITIECWPRQIDVTDPTARQFPGWPVTIDQLDNYGRKAVAYLPTVKVTGQTNPVVQVVDEADGQIVYTLRIKGDTFRPKVFRKGSYTVKVGEGNSLQTFKGVKSLPADKSATLKVTSPRAGG